MNVFGVGPMELFFIVLLAMIILGPKDMVKFGYQLGQFLRRTIFSPSWVDIQRKVRQLPNQLMREIGIEESDLNLGLDTKIDLGLDSLGKPITIARPSNPLTPTFDQPASSVPADPMIATPPDGFSDGQSTEPPGGDGGMVVGGSLADMLETPQPQLYVADDAPSEWVTPPSTSQEPDQSTQQTGSDEIPGEWFLSPTHPPVSPHTLDKSTISSATTSDDGTGQG
jgi:Sec-independent protein translocase protein TatA